MGVRVSIVNDTDILHPIRGSIRYAGGSVVSGWEFNLECGRVFSKSDSGIMAGTDYDLEIFVKPNGQDSTFAYIKRFTAPSIFGKKKLSLAELIAHFAVQSPKENKETKEDEEMKLEDRR
mmetsp:Transcript_9813/g.19333  ORF Transcript_9813/g.19333 Transcript_9813/m.19333 type:complete len:120 (-) Transcript_9813:165-524(-)